jgi:hypothetical protein
LACAILAACSSDYTTKPASVELGDEAGAGDAGASAGDAAPTDGAADDTDGGESAEAGCAAAGSFGPGHGEAFSYGRHYPNGAAAVDYAYGSDGTWKEMNPLEYVDNYYQACATANHPFNQSALIAYANGTHFTTAGDANCHLLCDSNHDGEIDTKSCGFAFHEHDGKGAGGATTGTPFTNFWFDDNWLARYMSQAYARPLPNGLSSYSDFTRWRIVGGDRTQWIPYGTSYFDTLALDGLYALAGGDLTGALTKWNAILTMSGSTYDSATQRYVYPSIAENYHMALFKVLTDQILGDGGIDGTTRTSLVQHSEALRSNILDNQEKNGATLLGWRSDRTQATSLMNIESLTAAVLALGARAGTVFEPGVSPMQRDSNGYFLRPYHALSAVTGMSTAGMMTKGPGFEAPAGSYKVDFHLRAPQPSGTVAALQIYDALTSTILTSHDVDASEMAPNNQWTVVTLDADIAAGCHEIELRTIWPGAENLDVGSIRVR